MTHLSELFRLRPEGALKEGVFAAKGEKAANLAETACKLALSTRWQQ